MEVKLIRDNPDGSADYSFDMTDKEKEALLCFAIMTGIKNGFQYADKEVPVHWIKERRKSFS